MKRYRIFDDYTNHFWPGSFDTINEAYERIEQILLKVFCEFEGRVLSIDILSHIMHRQRCLRVVDVVENSCDYGCSGPIA